jgi:hypothetical protein
MPRRCCICPLLAAVCRSAASFCPLGRLNTPPERPYGPASVPTCSSFAGRHFSSKVGYVPARYERSRNARLMCWTRNSCLSRAARTKSGDRRFSSVWTTTKYPLGYGPSFSVGYLASLASMRSVSRDRKVGLSRREGHREGPRRRLGSRFSECAGPWAIPR